MNGNLIDLSSFVGQRISLFRFYHTDVEGYLADLGRKPRPVFTRQPLHASNKWRLISVKEGDEITYYLQNNATQRYVCFNRRGRPRLMSRKIRTKCDLNLFTVENEKYFVFRQKTTQWALGFCPNGRPFVATRPNSLRCSVRRRSARRWKHFKRCVACIPPACYLCRGKPLDFAPCRECHQAIVCNPGRKMLDRSALDSLIP